mmetsp:Transcript_14683/g.39129  ORF Transcript_14683/g.39129 Transcript_14683/m.39129 type:complete len:208 (+) Transcript_14683:638-1261(+)
MIPSLSVSMALSSISGAGGLRPVPLTSLRNSAVSGRSTSTLRSSSTEMVPEPSRSACLKKCSTISARCASNARPRPMHSSSPVDEKTRLTATGSGGGASVAPSAKRVAPSEALMVSYATLKPLTLHSSRSPVPLMTAFEKRRSLFARPAVSGSSRPISSEGSRTSDERLYAISVPSCSTPRTRAPPPRSSTTSEIAAPRLSAADISE